MAQIDAKYYAYQVVAKFLYDENLHETLETFKLEAEPVLSEIGKHFHRPAIQKPLQTILEDYKLQEMSADMAQTVIDKAVDRVLEEPGKGDYPSKVWKQFEDVHTLNITCVKTVALDGSFFGLNGTVQAVVSGGADKKLRVMNIENGSTLTFFITPSTPLGLDIHPTTRQIVACTSMDGSLILYDMDTQQILQQWKNHSKYATRCKFSPDGNWLVSGSYDKTVNIYQRSQEEAKDEMTSHLPHYKKVTSLTDFEGAVESMCFLPHQQVLVVGTRDDHLLHYIEMAPDFPRKKYNMNPNGDNWVSFTPMDIQPSPSGSHLLIYTDQKSGRLIIFRTNSSIQAKSLYGIECDGFSQPRCCWSPDGKYVFATSDDHAIWVYEVSSGRVVAKLRGHDGVVRDLIYDQDLNALVSASFDKTIKFWTKDGSDHDVEMS